MDLERLKLISEIAKNTVEVLAIFGGAFALWQWLFERYDRGTDVLLELEEKFNERQSVRGRTLIEDDVEYGKVVRLMQKAVLEATESIPLQQTGLSPSDNRQFEPLDSLLRFYVLLHGVRKARQVPDSALKACFRYWLTLYFHPYRPSFRAYVDTFFPTLKLWLQEDEAEVTETGKWWDRFFTPTEFGFVWTEQQKNDQFRRAIGGRVLVITGSGISADSDIPTFRGPEGYWRRVDPQKLATRKAFERRPKAVWKWYRERRKTISGSEPNEAHRALVTLAEASNEFLLVTQNVDDLHERARARNRCLPNSKMVHIHGRIFVTRCSSCDYEIVDRDSSARDVPECPECGARLRPDVVWFDEELNPKEKERVNTFLQKGPPCDLVLVIGTTAIFDYIRDWALEAAGHSGWLVEINPEETRLSCFANQVIRLGAAEALPALIEAAIANGPVGFK
jgi:NAD-dependent deacetylase